MGTPSLLPAALLCLVLTCAVWPPTAAAHRHGTPPRDSPPSTPPAPPSSDGPIPPPLPEARPSHLTRPIHPCLAALAPFLPMPSSPLEAPEGPHGLSAPAPASASDALGVLCSEECAPWARQALALDALESVTVPPYSKQGVHRRKDIPKHDRKLVKKAQKRWLKKMDYISKHPRLSGGLSRRAVDGAIVTMAVLCMKSEVAAAAPFLPDAEPQMCFATVPGAEQLVLRLAGAVAQALQPTHGPEFSQSLGSSQAMGRMPSPPPPPEPIVFDISRAVLSMPKDAPEQACSPCGRAVISALSETIEKSIPDHRLRDDNQHMPIPMPISAGAQMAAQESEDEDLDEHALSLDPAQRAGAELEGEDEDEENDESHGKARRLSKHRGRDMPHASPRGMRPFLPFLARLSSSFTENLCAVPPSESAQPPCYSTLFPSGELAPLLQAVVDACALSDSEGEESEHAQTCPPACFAALERASDEFGCCFGSLLSMAAEVANFKQLDRGFRQLKGHVHRQLHQSHWRQHTEGSSDHHHMSDQDGDARQPHDAAHHRAPLATERFDAMPAEASVEQARRAQRRQLFRALARTPCVVDTQEPCANPAQLPVSTIPAPSSAQVTNLMSTVQQAAQSQAQQAVSHSQHGMAPPVVAAIAAVAVVALAVVGWVIYRSRRAGASRGIATSVAAPVSMQQSSAPFSRLESENDDRDCAASPHEYHPPQLPPLSAPASV